MMACTRLVTIMVGSYRECRQRLVRAGEAGTRTMLRLRRVAAVEVEGAVPRLKKATRISFTKQLALAVEVDVRRGLLGHWPTVIAADESFYISCLPTNMARLKASNNPFEISIFNDTGRRHDMT